MASSAERQRAFKAKLAEQGLRQVFGYVHEHQLSDLLLLVARLRDNPDLQVGPVRNTATGRIERL